MKSTIGLSLPTYSYNTEHTALIIGAGLAGCAVANALAMRGFRCKLFDQQTTIAAATSALPAAVIRPVINNDQFHTSFYKKAFDLCCSELPTNLFKQCGLLQLSKSAPSSNNDDGQWMNASSASSQAGTHLSSDAWYFKRAGWINPASVCAHWIEHPRIEFSGNKHVNELKQTEYGWQLLAINAEVIDESALVILANASSILKFNVANHLPLQQIGGQIDRFSITGHLPHCIISGDSYLVPDIDTATGESRLWSGATHHRDQAFASVNVSDTRANNKSAHQLASALTLPNQAQASFAGLRTATPDRLPVVGALPDARRYLHEYSDLRHGKPADQFGPPAYHRGLYAAVGFGSRGATHALFVAEMLGQLITGECNETAVLQTLHPARFLNRALRKGQQRPSN